MGPYVGEILFAAGANERSLRPALLDDDALEAVEAATLASATRLFLLDGAASATAANNVKNNPL